MSMPLLKQQLSFYDYSDIVAIAEDRLGYSLRDVKGRFAGNHDAEYCDFWHWWLENIMYDNCFNGMYQGHVCMRDILDDAISDEAPAWVIEILTCYVDILGSEADEEITFLHWW